VDVENRDLVSLRELSIMFWKSWRPEQNQVRKEGGRKRRTVGNFHRVKIKFESLGIFLFSVDFSETRTTPVE